MFIFKSVHINRSYLRTLLIIKITADTILQKVMSRVIKLHYK